MKEEGISGSADSDKEFGLQPAKKKGVFGRFDFPSLSDVLGWTVIPVLLIIVVILVYTQLLLPIEPGSMEANMVGSREVGFGSAS
jgi:hypothetical protein